MDTLAELTEVLLYKQAVIIEEWMRDNGVTESDAVEYSLEITRNEYPDAYINLKRGDKIISKLHLHYEINVGD